MLSNRSVGAVVRLASTGSTKVAVPSSISLSASSLILVPNSNHIATFSATCQRSIDDGASQQHYYMSRTNKRTFSSKVNAKNVKPAAADRRLAGRRRFYKHVGIATASPPTRDQASSSSSSTNNDDSTKVVQSPISAGVDGTQSATGVNTTISNASTWSALLNPFDSNNHNNNNTQESSWHTVTLDNRTLRTPLGLPLTLPSLPLALAIASEWDSQKRYLQPAQMPLMTLCCTAIDQVASNPTSHQNDVIKYLMNDTSCYWADPTDDRVLHRRQLKAWDGLHDALSSNVLQLPNDLRPALAVGGGDAILLSRKSKDNSNSGLPHPPLLVRNAELWIKSLDAWTLTALYSACAESKSFFIGAALIHDALKSSSESTSTGGGTTFNNNNNYNEDGNNDEKEKTRNDIAIRDGKWAVQAARVEEEFNIECWGLVEGNHDYDRLNCSIQMHAASFLARTVATTATSTY